MQTSKRSRAGSAPDGAPRRAWLLSLLLVLSLLPIAIGHVGAASDPLSAEERAWLEDNGPILYAPDPAYPPFEFVDDAGEVRGINTDLLNRISRNLGIEFETVVYENWTVVLEAMQAGEVHLLGSLANYTEREAYMDFVGPYMRVGEVFYVRDDTTLESIEDLAGKDVAVIQDYAAGQWLAENHPEMHLVEVPDMVSGLQKVSVGEVDAFFENLPVGGYYIRQNAFSSVVILGEPLYYSPANWGVPEGHSILASIMTKGMASIPLGEQVSVFEYWTGQDLSPPRPPAEGLSPLARNLLTGTGLAVVAVGAWGITLRRQVRSRTASLEESRAFMRTVLDSNPELVYATD
ncbi:MAG: transporter substrate-binding domain-containing protein, partial [Candidatus Thermoplasmatota archaeon]|nr:transporter substrate-binding domain-containing protein [Candidatus Thermoplasmatota archaeon]